MCPSELKLSCYYDGQLSKIATFFLRRHIKKCDCCSKKLSYFQTFSNSLHFKEYNPTPAVKERLYKKIISSVNEYSNYRKNYLGYTPKKLAFIVPAVTLAAIVGLFSGWFIFSFVSNPQKGGASFSSVNSMVSNSKETDIISDSSSNLASSFSTPPMHKASSVNQSVQQHYNQRHFPWNLSSNVSIQSDSAYKNYPVFDNEQYAIELNSFIKKRLLSQEVPTIEFEIPSDISFSMQGYPDFEVLP